MYRFLLLAISFGILISCRSKKMDESNGIKEVQQFSGGIAEVPFLRINQKDFTAVNSSFFKESVGGEFITEETIVQLKYDSIFLYINFECRNNPRLDQNYYTEDNTPMFNQEIFEVFISQGPASSEKYLEIQLNPNNALYLASINNRFKSDNHFDIEFIDTKTSGVIHSVKKNKLTNTWIGELQIPLDLLNFPEMKVNKVFRLNFYRVISNQDHFEPEWSNNQDNATFACWSSTMTKKPQFHVPDRFGFLFLD
jgi:hypothetical protein